MLPKPPNMFRSAYFLFYAEIPFFQTEHMHDPVIGLFISRDEFGGSI